MSRSASRHLWRGLLPGTATRGPRWLMALLGAPLVVGGVLLATRPLSSLSVLAVAIGITGIVTGLGELVAEHRRPPVLRLAVGAAWVLGGLLVLLWLGRSIELLPVAVAVLLIAGAAASAAGVTRGGLGDRVLAAVNAVSQLAFAGLVLLWPDTTLLVTAVLFGGRVALHGATLLWRAVRGPARPAPSRRRLPWLAAGLVLVLAAIAVWGSTQLRSGLPVIDAFYSTPGSAPEEPGALLRDEAWPGTAPAGAEARRILYTTTDLHGEAALGNAIVVSASGRADAPSPVVLWDHGTTGVARACAPSLMDDALTRPTIPAIAEALDAGWVVVAPDYSGQGTEGAFPYLIGEGEARSGLDAVRAADAMTGIDLAAQTVVWGHSQGGHAALWTGELAPDYAPELDVVGVAALAPAADPLALAERILQDPSNPLLAIVVAWVLAPYDQAYPEIDLDELVHPAGRLLVREMAQRCLEDPGMLASIADALGVARDRPLFTGDLTTGAPGARLDENAARGPWTMPLLIAWGDRDEVIAPDLQHDLVQRLCDDGVDFSWVERPGDDHLTLLDDPALLDPLVAWTADRFAGADAPVPVCS